MQGLNPNGKLQMVRVDVDGKLVVTGVAGGGGGGGSSDTTEATQLLVKAAVQSVDTKTPALSGGKVPVTDPVALPLPAGAATAALQSTQLDRTPALVGGRIPVDGSGAIQLGAGPVSATTQRVTLASDGPEVTNSTAMVTKLTSVDNKTPALVNGRWPVDTDRVVKQLIDAASATVTYVCEASAVGTATSAAGWRVKRITVSGTVTMVQWGGTGAFDQIADNRATTVVYA